jgi:cytochrome c biogenesis protein CcdA/glutaredoxin
VIVGSRRANPGPRRQGGDRVGWAVSRRLLRVLPLVLVAVVWWGGAADGTAVGEAEQPASSTVELILFWGEGCPYCTAEREFLDELAATRPRLVVREYEVLDDEANQDRFRAMAAAAGIEARSVPTTFLGDRVWVGFGPATAAEIEAAVDAALEGREAPESGGAVIDVPLIGQVDVADRSLLVSTVVIGFVDGVNPCSLWVLSILLALVLHGGSRRRVAAVGVVFLVVTSAMYGLYIVGFYGVLQYARFLPWVQRAIAVVVGALGLLQLKDVVAFHRGPTLGVPERAKPGMYQRMRRLADTDRSLPVVLGSTAALAVGVSLLETPCTLGLPLLWTDLLARSEVALPTAVLLFGVYLVAFLIDELVVFAAVLVTMRAVKLQERHGRALKLVSGVLMVTLAAVMIVRPTLLETVGGALLVFGVAAVVAAVGLLADRVARREAPRPTV